MITSSYILSGWLIDGSGEPNQQNMLLGINNGMITSLKKGQEIDTSGAGIFDLSNCTILPGLVDAHVHLFMSGTSDPMIRQQQLDAKFEHMKEVISRHVFEQLSHGVVAIRDGGDYAGHALRYKATCLSSDKLPIILRLAGKAWRAPRRYGRLIGRPPSSKNTLAQAISHVKEPIDHIKIVNSGLNSLTEFGKETPPQFNLDQLKAAVQAANDLGLRVMVHANGELPVKLAIEAGSDSIEHGFFMGKDNLRRMAENQVTWVPTAYTMKAYHECLSSNGPEKTVSLKNFDHQIDQISRAMQYGVPIAVGTDCGSLGVHHGSSFKDELKVLIQAGMPLAKAVQCATMNSARLLGLEDDLGTLAPGMPATFVAVKGDPSCLPDALHAPEKIFIRGKLWEPAPTADSP